MSSSQPRSKPKIHWAKLFKYHTEVLSSVIWLLRLHYLQSLALEANSSLWLKILFNYAVSWLSCPTACPLCCLTSIKKQTNKQILKINIYRTVNYGSFSPYVSCHLSFKGFSAERQNAAPLGTYLESKWRAVLIWWPSTLFWYNEIL